MIAAQVVTYLRLDVMFANFGEINAIASISVLPFTHFKISFPRENEAIKHGLVELKVQCLEVFCYYCNKSTILLFYSIFRTTPEASSKLYFVEIC